jgi:peptide/nickel transport system ATP-binding protein
VKPLLQVTDLVVEFPADGGQRVHAVSGVSLAVQAGETVGLVGESGCGKSSLGRAILQAPRPTSGSVRFDGLELTSQRGEALRRVRPRLQLLLQDPIAALNPRRRIADIVAEPLEIWSQDDRRQREARVAAALEAVGLDIAAVGHRRPFEFSGGQCQRINIARALIMEPQLLICDEPVSALDVSVRAQIINLLEEAKSRFGLTMIFIGHDLAVVKNISDRIAVMYLGRMSEIAPSDALYRSPAHPYTSALLRSVPEPVVPGDAKPDSEILLGDLPSPIDPPSGCRFRSRCQRATPECVEQVPELREIGADHWVACHHPLWSDQLTAQQS